MILIKWFNRRDKYNRTKLASCKGYRCGNPSAGYDYDCGYADPPECDDCTCNMGCIDPRTETCPSCTCRYYPEKLCKYKGQQLCHGCIAHWMVREKHTKPYRRIL